MVEQITDMPDGTLGFRISGELTVEETKQLMDPIYAVVKDDGDLRMLFLIEGELKVKDPKVLWEDLKADYELDVKHRKNVKRTALVTDIEWLTRWIGLGGWLAPGEAKLFDPTALEDAKAWAAG